MLIEIKNWATGETIYSMESVSLKEALEEAVLAGIDLSYAKLNRAELNGAKLNGAKLNGAKLNGAELNGAKLNGAKLNGAELNGAKLNGAKLNRAELNRAELNRAELNGAKADLYMTLVAAIPELPGLKKALMEGRINGSQYEGDCACLVGTIANIRHEDYATLKGITADSSRPSERIFLAIKKGDTPENNPIAKIILGWIEEFESYIYPVTGEPLKIIEVQNG
jgi:uncharacterized protein YjbI with pentapeptide repeats